MINLWEKGSVPLFNKEIDQDEPTLKEYIVKGSKSAVIICPGGGYSKKSYHEGEPYALWLNSLGISAFVLDYRVYPYHYPAPLLDIQRAVRYVRYNCENYGFDSDKIGVCGSSAGGHLSALASTTSDTELDQYKINDDIDKTSSKTNFAILAYPVVTFNNHGHKGSFNCLCGENEDLRAVLSIENRVNEHTCPMFIWHTADDGSVKSLNPMILASALYENNVSYELHIFKEGRHGLGLAKDDPYVRNWLFLCEKWLKDMGF